MGNSITAGTTLHCQHIFFNLQYNFINDSLLLTLVRLCPIPKGEVGSLSLWHAPVLSQQNQPHAAPLT